MRKIDSSQIIQIDPDSILESEKEERKSPNQYQVQIRFEPIKLNDNSMSLNQSFNNSKSRVSKMESKIFNQKKLSLTFSKLIQNNYFAHDTRSQSIQRKSIIKREHLDQLQNYYVEWNWSHFLEFLFYHMVIFIKLLNIQLFFFILGPFIVIPLHKKRILLRNMEFHGLSLVFFVQSTLYITNIYCTISFFIYSQENTYFVEILYLWILMLNVCIIISSKYATFSIQKVEIYKNSVLPIARKKKEQYLHFHTPNSQEARYIELYSSFKRHEFEPSLFYFSFFQQPDESLVTQLNDLTQQLSQNHKAKKEKFLSGPLIRNIKEQYSGYGLINKLFQEYEKIDGWLWVLVKAWVMAILMSLIPIIYRLARSVSFNNGFYQIFYFIFLLMGNSYCTFIMTIFLVTSFREVKRKKYLMTQCEYLICQKTYEDCNRIFKLIDIMDRKSIDCWSMIRQVCLDYAKQYQIRSQAFYSVIILQCIFSLLSLLLFFFELVEFHLLTIIQNICWAIIFLVMLFKLIVQMAHLNQYFIKYRSLLEDWKMIFNDLISLEDYYFDNQIDAENEIYKIIVGTLNDYDYNDKKYKLQGLIEALDDALRNLNYDERNNSQQFYGFPITFDLLYSFQVGLGSIFGYAMQYYYFS